MNTKTDFFGSCKTVEEIKKLYRELAKQHHPDLNPAERRDECNEIMKAINAAYHAALKGQHGTTRTGSDGRDHTYSYDEEIEQAIVNKIAELLALKMADVEVWLIGLWVWIIGDTKPHKEELKGASCTWHSKRKCWYWKPYEGNGFYSRASLGALAEQYGAKRFSNDDDSKSGSKKQKQQKRQRSTGRAQLSS